MIPLGVKTGTTRGSQVGTKGTKKIEFICGENDSGERSSAIMALLFKFWYGHLPLKSYYCYCFRDPLVKGQDHSDFQQCSRSGLPLSK